MKNENKKYFGIAQFARWLWVQLAISYSILAFCAITSLFIMLYAINDYNDFNAATKISNIETQINSTNFLVKQALIEKEGIIWREQALKDIKSKLENLEQESVNSVYKITNSSRPKAYIQITDTSDNIIIGDPPFLPKENLENFNLQKKKIGAYDASSYMKNGDWHYFAKLIYNDNNVPIGKLLIAFSAKFDPIIEAQSILNFLFSTWIYVSFLSVPIGVACGLMANFYLKRQLQKINYTTERWGRGDFSARITLPNDDVLLQHSKFLNSMAQDMESFFTLKQGLAINDERNRLARELHDTIKQKLFALGLQIATIKSKYQDTKHIEDNIFEAQAIIKEAQHDMVDILTQMQPANLSKEIFYERVLALISDFKRRFNISIKMNGFEGFQATPIVEHNLFRIMQEAIINALKHGQADKIFLSLSINSGLSNLSIDDNGTGFDFDKIIDGFGIHSMRDRALALPFGTFDILSTCEAGTKIIVNWKN